MSAAAGAFRHLFKGFSSDFWKTFRGGGEWKSGTCELVRKETLCATRGEPVRRLTFRVPPGETMDVDVALRQVVVLPVQGRLRMYSPTTEPNQTDGTFDLVVRIYREGRVSQWLDQVPLSSQVPMIWPWPTPLTPGRRNAGTRVGLVAFGVGITELYRVAANELRDKRVEEVVLLYATRLAEEQKVLREELQELLALHGPRFRLQGAVSRERDPRYLHGRVDTAMLSTVFPWADARRDNVRFLTSGTEEMMDSTLAALDGLGYDRTKYELIRDASISSIFRGMLA